MTERLEATKEVESASDAPTKRRRKPRTQRPHLWKPLMPRIEAKTVVNSIGCHVWQGNTNGDGYGTIFWNSRSWLTHRAVYTHEVGEIPEGMQIHHVCENRLCHNPRHLATIGLVEHALLTKGTFGNVNAPKTHCKRGHEFTPDNTRTLRRGNGTTARVCKACVRIWNDENRERILARRRELRAQRRKAA